VAAPEQRLDTVRLSVVIPVFNEKATVATIVERVRAVALPLTEVHAMPIWESQQFIMQELHGIPTSSPIDFDRFSAPFDQPFDLRVCNHMLNHAVRLDIWTPISDADRTGRIAAYRRARDRAAL
jgi:hypothetical protein